MSWGKQQEQLGGVFNALGDVTDDSFLKMMGTISGAVAQILPEVGN